MAKKLSREEEERRFAEMQATLKKAIEGAKYTNESAERWNRITACMNLLHMFRSHDAVKPESFQEETLPKDQEELLRQVVAHLSREVKSWAPS